MKNCMIIPIYEKCNSKLKRILQNNLAKTAGWKTIFIYPNGFSMELLTEYQNWLSGGGVDFVEISEWQNSVESYNQLMLSVAFYERFREYEYMLICHTDALLLQPIEKMEKKFCEELHVGYVGAPWFHPDGTVGEITYRRMLHGMGKIGIINKLCEPRRAQIGNGGCSLRHLAGTISLLQKYNRKSKWNMHEDAFFAYYGQRVKGFLPTVEDAQYFALELMAREKMQEGILPFGVHGWEKVYPEILDDFPEYFEESLRCVSTEFAGESR